MRFRMNRPGASLGSVLAFGRMGLISKAAPASAPTLNPEPDPNTCVGGNEAVDNRTHSHSDDRRLIALEYLQRAADDLNQAALTRLRYIGAARKYGATWRDISITLGLTETGARKLYERNSDLLGGDA